MPLLRFVALFNTKISLFVTGRQEVFDRLNLDSTKKTVWIHAASLGEFEQGRPVIEKIKNEFSEHQILVTFFSPSGYEVRKNYDLANFVSYLPMDTLSNVKRFVKIVQPSIAVFIKYEIWPNYLIELKNQGIPTVLVSGIFRENQVFFKFYGSWMRSVLRCFTDFFVQDEVSKNLLSSIGIDTVSVVGDTRFDRVQKLVENNEKLTEINNFKNNSYLLVAGSTWLEDEEKLVAYINKANEKEKFIIAPHNIKSEDIYTLQASIEKTSILYTEREGKNVSDYQVMIVDTFGILSKIYAYADVAYIGGGYTKSGVHNILEAATYGLPIVIGPNFKKFKEVKDLVRLKGCLSVDNTDDLVNVLKSFYNDEVLRAEKQKITKQYVQSNLGATEQIMKTINFILNDEKK